MKIIKVLLLSLILLSCEDNMTGSKVNSYTPTDPNPENMQETMDTSRRGDMALSLSNFDNTSVPQIEAGSTVDISGSLYEFDTIDTINTTDPGTSSTVVDGTVYIALFASGDTVTSYWTATAPTWDATKQGYYHTFSSDVYRYVGGCVLDSGTYSGKFIYNGKDDFTSGSLTVILVEQSSSTAYNPVVFDSELKDTLNEYDVSTGITTLKIDGIYEITTMTKVNSLAQNQRMKTSIQIDIGAGYVLRAINENHNAGTATSVSCLCSKTFELSAGDKIQILSTGTLDVTAASNYLSIIRIK